MEEAVRLMQQTLRTVPTVKKRAKTVYSQRNLGTIRDRKREKKQEASGGSGDMILRILRMRCGVAIMNDGHALSPWHRPNSAEFLAQQFDAYTQVQGEQRRESTNRKNWSRNRFSQPDTALVPSLPGRS